MAYNNVKVKEHQTTQQTQQSQQIGVVSEVPMNGWNATISYEKLNVVTHKNSTFIAKRPNVGIEPFITPGWQDVWMTLLNGVGISEVDIEYASGSTASSEPPQNGWGANIPALKSGQYLWGRITITYSDGKRTVFYTVGAGGVPTRTSELVNDGDGTDPFATTSEVSESVKAESDRARDIENGLDARVKTIEDEIPPQASKTNQLADKSFVNSSINNLAAFYITYNAQDDAFPTKAALTGATTFYNDKKPRIPTTNDYAIVRTDESQPKNVDGSYPTTRYIYQGGTYPQGSWSFQWIINNTPFTQAQINALNSGISTSGVEQITTNKNDIADEIARAKAVEKANAVAAAAAQATANSAKSKADTAVQPETLKNYVTTDTKQNIAGAKTFQDSLTVAHEPSGQTVVNSTDIEITDNEAGGVVTRYRSREIICEFGERGRAQISLPTTSGDLALKTDMPASLPPSGTAGGDLTGTYPNPTVANGKITKAKLDSPVQESLEKADTALQSHQSLANYYTKSETENAISTAISDAITTVLNTPV